MVQFWFPTRTGGETAKYSKYAKPGDLLRCLRESAADGRSKAHAGGVLPVRALAPAFLPGFIGPEALGETLESVKGR